jgi:hypothetical protein
VKSTQFTLTISVIQRTLYLQSKQGGELPITEAYKKALSEFYDARCKEEEYYDELEKIEKIRKASLEESNLKDIDKHEYSRFGNKADDLKTHSYFMKRSEELRKERLKTLGKPLNTELRLRRKDYPELTDIQWKIHLSIYKSDRLLKTEKDARNRRMRLALLAGADINGVEHYKFRKTTAQFSKMEQLQMNQVKKEFEKQNEQMQLANSDNSLTRITPLKLSHASA